MGALVRGETSPRVPVPGGRQVLTLVSSSVFLKADVVVQVPPGGEVPLQAPLAGKLNVRTAPDGSPRLVHHRVTERGQGNPVPRVTGRSRNSDRSVLYSDRSSGI